VTYWNWSRYFIQAILTSGGSRPSVAGTHVCVCVGGGVVSIHYHVARIRSGFASHTRHKDEIHQRSILLVSNACPSSIPHHFNCTVWETVNYQVISTVMIWARVNYHKLRNECILKHNTTWLLDAKRCLWPLVPPEGGGFTTEACRGNIMTKIHIYRQCAFVGLP
jgi:hypothetical protein